MFCPGVLISSMINNGAKEEHAALNIIQNFACAALYADAMDKDIKNEILQCMPNSISADVDPMLANLLCLDINDEKFAKGFINSEQHREGKLLSLNLFLQRVNASKRFK